MNRVQSVTIDEPETKHQFDYYCTWSKQWVSIYLSSPDDSVIQIKQNYLKDGFMIRNPKSEVSPQASFNS